MRHRSIVLAAAIALIGALSAAAPASAALRDEVRAGQAIADRLDSGQAGCDQLSDTDFEHLGEYVMNRMAGSLAAHEAMNARMREVMGAAFEERMHVLMGQRFAGCGAQGSSGQMGPGMMGGGAGPGGWGRMMSSPMWSWMGDGSWRHMNRGDWQRVSDQWMGPGMMSGRDHGWGAGDALLLIVVVLLSAGLVVGLVSLRDRRRAALRRS